MIYDFLFIIDNVHNLLSFGALFFDVALSGLYEYGGTFFTQGSALCY